jgi:hypothetical protein
MKLVTWPLNVIVPFLTSFQCLIIPSATQLASTMGATGVPVAMGSKVCGRSQGLVTVNGANPVTICCKFNSSVSTCWPLLPVLLSNPNVRSCDGDGAAVVCAAV